VNLHGSHGFESHSRRQNTISWRDSKMYENESAVVEYKSRPIEPKKITKEIVAFSNTRGGTLIFGIDDSGNVVGVDFPKKLEEDIANICRNNCEPPITAEFEQQVKKGKRILIIKVPKGDSSPYKSKLDGRFYIRIGSTVREASTPELVRLFSNGPYKPLLLMLAKLTDLKNEACAALESQTKEGDNVTIQKSLELKRMILDLDSYEGIMDGLKVFSDIANECSVQFLRTGKAITPLKKLSEIIGRTALDIDYFSKIDSSQAEEIWQFLKDILLNILRFSFDFEKPAEPFPAILSTLQDFAVEAHKRGLDDLGNDVAIILRDFKEHLEYLQSHVEKYQNRSFPKSWIEVLKLSKEAMRYFPLDKDKKTRTIDSLSDIRNYFLFNQTFIEEWGGDWLDGAFRQNPDRILKASTFLGLWKKGYGMLMSKKACQCLCGRTLEEIVSLKGFLGEFNEFYVHLYFCEECNRKTVGFFHKY
jgi:hypothetical protein